VFESLESLRDSGFDGFVAVCSLRETAARSVPPTPGVYLVVRPSSAPAHFLSESTGGWHKGRDPTVPVTVLEGAWIPEALVLYIGKAGKVGSDANLRDRIRAYLSFGAGRRVGHWGGRFIWQLANQDDLLVAWRVATAAEARPLERALLADFRRCYAGRLPFANRAS